MNWSLTAASRVVQELELLPFSVFVLSELFTVNCSVRVSFFLHFTRNTRHQILVEDVQYLDWF